MPELNAIGIVASDLRQSIAFYRLLGVDFPEDGEGHIEATLPSGTRFMLDSEVAGVRVLSPRQFARFVTRPTGSSGRAASRSPRSCSTRSR